MGERSFEQIVAKLGQQDEVKVNSSSSKLIHGIGPSVMGPSLDFNGKNVGLDKMGVSCTRFALDGVVIVTGVAFAFDETLPILFLWRLHLKAPGCLDGEQRHWVLHDWDDRCLKLLKNCYNAVPEFAETGSGYRPNYGYTAHLTIVNESNDTKSSTGSPVLVLPKERI
ncbi:O-methyltransferase, family 2 [Corchorus olitorius]|uniref:O-methyltransferase, family 2 n=1 Tax=Corchorus olitorius TaxID=93759 RepID=A0A1R3HJF1_9ROSI|nr:O-methyltransferase, family 2 [Corchorus olitorius]